MTPSDSRATGEPITVRDAEHLRSANARIANSRERISGLARLRHRHHQRGGRDDRVAVAELGSHFYFSWNTCPSFDQAFRDKAGMIARAAPDDVDTIDEVQLLSCEAQLIDHDLLVR